MDMNLRMEAIKLIDDITSAESEFFRVSDAKRLVEIVPVTPNPILNLSADWRLSGGSMQGHAAGVGDVSLEDEEKTGSWRFNEGKVERVGGYKLEHHVDGRVGSLSISQMWAKTYEDKTGRSCSLIYNAATGNPKYLKLAHQRSLSLSIPWFKGGAHIFGLNFITYPVWKYPERVR